MRSYTISASGEGVSDLLQQKIDTKTKPLGSLGKLEKVALQIGTIQNTIEPYLDTPTIIVFAADHGIVLDEQVSKYPQEVTWQMVQNFLDGGAAINVFASQNKMHLTIVDAGVNHEFQSSKGLKDAKIGFGTKSYLQGSAMTAAEMDQALEKGADLVVEVAIEGSNVIGFGEMGIGNTSSAALLMSAITKLPLEACVGAGTGLDDESLQHKLQVLKKVQEHHGDIEDPLKALEAFGGFEIAMMCGAILQAADLKMVILIDGFIVTSALLVAAELYPEVLQYCIFTHHSNEQGHTKMLEFLGADPLLNLDLRLGEGTGAALCYPIVESSLRFLNEMASFESAKVADC